MSIDRIRRGVEFDAFHALRALPKSYLDNPSAYDVGEIASYHFEKFAYICADVHWGQIEEQVGQLAKSLVEFSKTMTNGEKYYMHEEGFTKEIQDRLAEFLDGRRNNTPDPWSP